MNFRIREIRKEDNPHIQKIIQTVMPEFGANSQGFALHDKAVTKMYEVYQTVGSTYFVCEENERIVGGGGISKLEGGDSGICELQKMYFLKDARGKGYGQMMLSQCLSSAAKFGYKICYLETFHTMQSAMQLYEKNGFNRIPSALGQTGHFGCDTFYVKEL
jgi:putative acetyltransferase